MLRKGFAALRRDVPQLLAQDHPRLTVVLREVVTESFERFQFTEQRLAHYDRKLAQLCRQDPRCLRLLAVEGIGPTWLHCYVSRPHYRPPQ